MAWIGSPVPGGGVGGMCRTYLRELAQLDVRIDIYSNNDTASLAEFEHLRKNPNIRFFPFTYVWNWNSWYGRNNKVAFVMSFIKRLRSYRRLVDAVVAEHRRESYDAVVQFSQGELFRLGRHHREIPIILFPCVHAAGELYWCRREQALARQCEPFLWRWVRNAYLAYRARLQRRDYNRARGVIGMSRRFNAWVRRDYRVPADRLGVVYQPIDLPVTQLTSEAESLPRPIRLLFVGRISVRKGLDLLLRVLPDLFERHHSIEATVIGAGSLWSNYEPLLSGLPTQRCRWLKSLPNNEVTAEMRRSDILLVPSLYEPGGIVVAEALANGMYIVSSDEVGSAENLPEALCAEFPAGNVQEFALAIEKAMVAVGHRRMAIRADAARIASEQFAPAKMAQLLLGEVRRLVARSESSLASERP